MRRAAAAARDANLLAESTAMPPQFAASAREQGGLAAARSDGAGIATLERLVAMRQW
jgi:hypothetical protein